MLPRLALLSVTIGAGCSADVNPVAPGGTSTVRSLVAGSSTAAAQRPAHEGKVAIFHRTAVNEYLSWGGIHPTHAAHALVAHEAARVL